MLHLWTEYIRHAKLLPAQQRGKNTQPTLNFTAFLMTLVTILVNNAIFNTKNINYTWYTVAVHTTQCKEIG